MLNIINSSNATMLNVTWSPASSDYCGGIVYYLVEILLRGQLVRSITTNMSNYTFDNLTNEVVYTIRVTPFNSAGNGMPETINAMSTGMYDALLNYVSPLATYL